MVRFLKFIGRILASPLILLILFLVEVIVFIFISSLIIRKLLGKEVARSYKELLVVVLSNIWLPFVVTYNWVIYGKFIRVEGI